MTTETKYQKSDQLNVRGKLCTEMRLFIAAILCELILLILVLIWKDTTVKYLKEYYTL